jgi:hypothetical protein
VLKKRGAVEHGRLFFTISQSTNVISSYSPTVATPLYQIVQEQPDKASTDSYQQQHSSPPPPYSPEITDLYTMSVESSSIITQASSPIFHPGAFEFDGEPSENVRLNLRGTMFDLPREELLSLPESILLGISSGAVYDNDGTSSNLAEASSATANTMSPECLQYTLDVFRQAAEEVPYGGLSSDYQHESEDESVPAQGGVQGPVHEPESMANISEILRRRPAIIVLREDLDYYCMPTTPDMDRETMKMIKRNCGDVIVQQKTIFSGLRKGQVSGSPEHHLIEMLCSSGFKIDDEWGFRALEPHKTVVSSVALIRLVTDDEKTDNEQELSTPHKLLLFWRKPARKCWWDSVNLDKVEGVDGPLRVHVRRVWTLELSVIGVR